MTSEQHTGQKGLESTPSLIPSPPFFLWRRRPWRAACPQAWRSNQFTAALVIRAPLHPCPPPPPPARRSTLLGGCLRCQWLPSQEEAAPGAWAGRRGQPQCLPPGPPVPADGGWRSCPPVAWQVQTTHSCLGERMTESCVPET